MSVHVIYYKDGVKMMRPVLNREEYLRLRDGGYQKPNLSRIRQGEVKLKGDLVQMNYSCLPNEDGTLKGSKRASMSVCMDIDFKAPEGLSEEEKKAWLREQMAKVPELVMSRKGELVPLMLERSATKGYHLAFRRRPELDQEGNLKWASELLGIMYDAQAKDITRVYFTTTADVGELLYLDDEIFSVAEADTSRDVTALQRYSSRGSSSGGSSSDGSSSSPKLGEVRRGLNGGQSNGQNAGSDSTVQTTPPDGTPPNLGGEEVTKYPDSYHGMAFTEILKKYWELHNEGKEPVEGDRDTLTFQLASDLRHICGRNADWLDQVIPCYDNFPQDEKRKKIESALSLKMEGMPYRLKQVLQALKAQSAVKACGGTMTTPPPMPKRLPPLIKLLTKNVPWFYKPAVASAVFPALGAHLHGVKFRYWDNVDHEATFMNVLIGRQSIGKGTIKKPIEYIMEDIRLRDIPNRQREAEWKQKNPGAKQKKDPRPTDICIQMLIDNLTDAVFNQRIVDAHNNGERYIFTCVDEIEALKKVTSRGTVDEVGLLIRKAFDNSLAGQERVGTDSVSGIAPLRWNFNASTTPPNARKFLWKMVNDGTVSRLDIATIILGGNDDDDDIAPILGIYDHTFAQELKPYIDRLDTASGLIECQQAKKLSLEIKQENRDVAKLYESDAYRVFSYRANVIAWLKGMVLFVAHGYKWSREIADFVRWSQKYNLWCKMLYFGQQLEKELREEVEIQRQSGPQNMLELLPDEFTREQYYQMRQSQGRTADGDSTLRVWTKRGHIVFDVTTGRYCKTETYKKKFGNKS